MTEGIAHIDIAAMIGRQLARDAIWSEDACTWMGWSWRRARGPWLAAWSALGPDLGDGTAGVGLFLAELARITDDRLIRKTAHGALRMAARTAPFDAGAAGVCKGRPGIAVALAMADAALGEGGYGAVAHDMLRDVAGSDTDRAAMFDGAAGAVQALVVGHHHFGDPALLEGAERIAAALIARAQKDDGRLSWADPPGNADHPPLLGLAHGTDGIACALAHLFRATGNTAWRDGAEGALAYSAHHFDKLRQLWPDLRIGAGAPHLAAANPARYPVTWEYGATGIALARLGLAEAMPEREASLPELEAGIAALLAVTDLAVTPVRDFTLANGFAGNAEALLDASIRLERPDLAQNVAMIAQFGAQNCVALRMPWPTGAPNGGEAPGMLTGLAGIGRFYLRLHDPASVPSLLIPQVRPLLAAAPPAAKKPARKKPARKKPAPKKPAAKTPVAKPAAAPPPVQAVAAPAKPKPAARKRAARKPASDTAADRIARKRAARPRRASTEPDSPRFPAGEGPEPAPQSAPSAPRKDDDT